MARAPKDYAKLYKNSIIQIEKSNEICYELRKKVESSITWKCKSER